MKKIKMTLERLAGEMKKGFARVDKRFDKVDQKFVEMESRIEKKIDDKVDSLARMVKTGFDEVDERFCQVDEEFRQVNEKIDGYNKRSGITNIRLDNLERGQDKIAERLGVMERKRA